MRYEGIVFDLDGVICFTDKYHYLAWKALADRLGIYFDEKINNRLRGVSRMASLDIILEKSDKTYTSEEKEEWATEKNNTYKDLLKNMSESDVGKLRIGAGESVTKNILKKTIIEFKKLHPGITIELYNSSSEKLYNDFRYGRLDLIFINSRHRLTKFLLTCPTVSRIII